MKDRKAFEKKERALLDFARSYLSEEFPNPDREGCPPDDVLRSLAFNPRESDPEVTEHLAACSPCFRRYSEFLYELKTQQKAESSWSRISVWSKAHPVLSGTALACALFMAIGVGLLLRGIRQANAPPVETNRKPSPTEPQNPTVTSLPFGLDLSALSPVRGSESPTGIQRRILVPNARLDLALTLPLASPEGTYEVKLVGGGQTFLSKSAQAHLRKGKTLIQVEVDLTKIQAGNYALEVRSTLTGIRLIQPVSIQAPLPNSGEQRP